MAVTLNQSQIDQYYEQGYFIVKGALSDADFEPIETAYSALIDERVKDFKARGLIEDLYEDEPFATRFARIAPCQSSVRSRSNASGATQAIPQKTGRKPSQLGPIAAPRPPPS